MRLSQFPMQWRRLVWYRRMSLTRLKERNFVSKIDSAPIQEVVATITTTQKVVVTV